MAQPPPTTHHPSPREGRGDENYETATVSLRVGGRGCSKICLGIGQLILKGWLAVLYFCQALVSFLNFFFPGSSPLKLITFFIPLKMILFFL